VDAGPDAGPLICRGALPAPTCARWLARLGTEGPSRPLKALDDDAVLGSAEVLEAVAASVLRAAVEARLGPAPRCNLSQSWLRHGRPAHHWHQDGALHFDFLAHAGRSPPAGALLDMLTCWIALTPCGEHAPGLEWPASATPRLLPPAELTDAAVQAAHAPAGFVRPRLQPGDAVLFDGTLLHRTHLTPQMRLPRASLELRFFRAGRLPGRVAGDAFAGLA
jgi:ectoine hydroxylase-related dioxygenase (phytanoyl-CoA dioxygenase family)